MAQSVLASASSASSGQKVVINPDDLHGTDGTVLTGLRLWSSRNGPVTFQTWQSVYFGLKREFDANDEGRYDADGRMIRKDEEKEQGAGDEEDEDVGVKKKAKKEKKEKKDKKSKR